MWEGSDQDSEQDSEKDRQDCRASYLLVGRVQCGGESDDRLQLPNWQVMWQAARRSLPVPGWQQTILHSPPLHPCTTPLLEASNESLCSAG